MAFTVIAFHKAAVSASLLALSGKADDHVTVSGADITVPELNQIVGAWIQGTTLELAQIQSPSLRRLFHEDISKEPDITWPYGLEANLEDYRENPIELVIAEKLNVFTKHGSSGLAFIWLADGPIERVTGEIRTIRATASISASAHVWTSGAITLGQTLPAGRYAVVGMRAIEGPLKVARLIFVGYSWRPGVVGVTERAVCDIKLFRRGRFGTFGEFEFDQPPKLEVYGDGGLSSQEIFLDLIQVRAGRE